MAIPEDKSLAALVELHPELRTADALVPLDEGFGAHLFATADGAIVRIPLSVEAGRRMTTVAAMAALAPRLPAPIPEPLWIDPMAYGLPFGAMAYRRLDGIPLNPHNLSSDLAADIARFLSVLHTIAPGDAGAAIDHIPNRAAIDAGRTESMEVALPWLRTRLSTTTMHCLESWWGRYQEFRANDRSGDVLVHGDFWYGNLLTDSSRTRLTGVLDWENTAYDDAAQDFATLLHAGRTVADRILELSCAMAGNDPEPVRSRREWYWAYREFSGLAAAIISHDTGEMMESLDKLRFGALQACFDPDTR